MSGHTIRRRRMYHDRDLGGRNFLSCLIHGKQVGPISQQDAEIGHAEGRKCPACDDEVRAALSYQTQPQGTP